MSPVKNFLPKTMMPLMKLPQSEREKLFLSAPKNNPKQWSKAPQNIV